MNQRDPYNAVNDPNHPGVQGRSFHEASEKGKPLPGTPVDSTGTGTLPPDQQGNINRVQPTGLSAATQPSAEASATEELKTEPEIDEFGNPID